ncbi:MAG: hypothetical protein PVF87_00225 [Acidimicrobiia bacterium]|jgi:Flp pilus assembly pilin Flp
MKFFRNVFSSDRGTSMVEYGLIVSVISMLSVSAVTLLGDNTEETFTEVAEAIDQAGAGGAGGEAVQSSNGGSSGGGATTSTTTPATTTTTAPSTTTTTAAPATTTTVPATTTTTAAAPQNEQGADDQGADVDVDSEIATAEPTTTESSFAFWNDTKHGGDGEWNASVTFDNESKGDQYLTLKVTTVDHKGKTKTTTVEGFLVPAGGSAIFDHPGNEMRDHKGRITGVMEVQVQVIEVATSDPNGEPVSYSPSDGPVSTVAAPAIP